MQELDDAVQRLAPGAFALLEDLVRIDSTLGREAGAQEVLAVELEELGFAIDRLLIPESIADDPLAGVPQLAYTGRFDLVARRPGSDPAAPSLLLNGHVDTVPVEDQGAWSSPPFVPTTRDGWLRGRGAADMKGGFAMAVLALRALDAARPGWQRGDLTLLAVVEQECTGNGTLAAARAGVLADEAVLLEPTDLDLLLAGVAITWLRIEVAGRSGPPEAAGRSINPVMAAAPLLAGLGALEQRMNDEHRRGGDPVFAGVEAPYAVNVGRFASGAWPSSVPEAATIDIRVGHPGAWSAEEALEQVRCAVRDAAGDDPWLAEHPPTVALTGFRAERYAQDPDHPLVRRFAAAHQAVHGRPPGRVALGATTDARYYVNRFGVPAVAYGPRVRNLHGVDEAVELSSIVDGARTLARFLLDRGRPAPRPHR